MYSQKEWFEQEPIKAFLKRTEELKSSDDSQLVAAAEWLRFPVGKKIVLTASIIDTDLARYTLVNSLNVNSFGTPKDEFKSILPGMEVENIDWGPKVDRDRAKQDINSFIERYMDDPEAIMELINNLPR